jgi:hypothetical protein
LADTFRFGALFGRGFKDHAGCIAKAKKNGQQVTVNADSNGQVVTRQSTFAATTPAASNGGRGRFLC